MSKKIVETLAVGSLPRVDLLPAATKDAIRRRPIVRRLVVGVVAVALATLLAVAGASLLALIAGDRLQAERERSESLLAAQLEFAEARAVANALDEATAAQTLGTQYEADWNALLEEIKATLPEGVTLRSVQGKLSEALLAGTGDEQGVVNEIPLRGASVGSFVIEAGSENVPDVEAWLGRLEGITGFAGIAPPTSVNGGVNEGYVVKIEVLIDEGIFIGRFAAIPDETGSDEGGN